MKRIAEIFTMLALAVMAAACGPENIPSPEFIGSDEIKLEMDGKLIFSYNENICQMAFNRDMHEFRVSDDSMQNYFILKVDQMPEVLDQVVTGNISWATDRDLGSKKQITLKVVRLEGERIWLWSSNHQIGVTVDVLD